MPDQIDLQKIPNHIGGGFEWETPPACCNLLKEAVDRERFIFVSNLTDRDGNLFYMSPLNADGRLARSGGVQVIHCPWCGTKISARKR